MHPDAMDQCTGKYEEDDYKPDFRVGDRVWSAVGFVSVKEGDTNGTITRILPNIGPYEAIGVKFDGDYEEVFFLPDGRFDDSHGEPSLFHAKPKMEIPPPPKRTVKRWVNLLTGSGYATFGSREHAESYARALRLGGRYYAGPIEVEVPE